MNSELPSHEILPGLLTELQQGEKTLSGNLNCKANGDPGRLCRNEHGLPVVVDKLTVFTSCTCISHVCCCRCVCALSVMIKSCIKVPLVCTGVIQAQRSAPGMDVCFHRSKTSRKRSVCANLSLLEVLKQETLQCNMLLILCSDAISSKEKRG